MTKRRKKRKEFLQYFRPTQVPPSINPNRPLNVEITIRSPETGTAVQTQVRVSGADLHQIARDAKILSNMTGAEIQIRVMHRGLPSRNEKADIPSHWVPIDLPIEELLGDAIHQHSDFAHLQHADPFAQNSQNPTQPTHNLGLENFSHAWVEMPKDARREWVQNILRNFQPSSLQQQDALRLFLNSGPLQQVLQNSNLLQGGVQLFQQAQLLATLLPFLIVIQNTPQNPENPQVNTSLLSSWIQGQNINPPQIAQALHSLLNPGASSAANASTLFALQSAVGFLVSQGADATQVQSLLQQLLQNESASKSSQGHSISSTEIQQAAARLMTLSHPQLLGFNVALQGNIGSGLSQIFGSLLRVFLGPLILQGQHQWPQALPHERMLNELGSLLAQSKMPETEKKKNPIKKRDSRRVEAIQADSDSQSSDEYYPEPEDENPEEKK